MVSARAVIIGNVILSFCLVVTIQLGWEVADSRSAKPLIMQIAALKQPGDKVATIGSYYQDIAPYLNQTICVIDYNPNELQFGMEQEDTTSWMISSAEFIKQTRLGQIFYIIIDNSQLNFFENSNLDKFKIIAKKGNNLLLSNKR